MNRKPVVGSRSLVHDGPVLAIAEFNGDLHGGGRFSTARGVEATGIVRRRGPLPNACLARCGCACYANCDGSTASPALTVNDLFCFQGGFAAGDPYADCDGSNEAPVLTVNDFICFQSVFAAGCPSRLERAGPAQA